MIVAGADPGFAGCVCFLEVEEQRVIGVVDVPTVKKASGRREILLHELVSDCLQTLDGRRCAHLVIERVNAFGMGVASAFSFGECFMALKMLAVCNGWPFTLVGAPQWKRAF